MVPWLERIGAASGGVDSETACIDDRHTDFGHLVLTGCGVSIPERQDTMNCEKAGSIVIAGYRRTRLGGGGRPEWQKHEIKRYAAARFGPTTAVRMFMDDRKTAGCNPSRLHAAKRMLAMLEPAGGHVVIAELDRAPCPPGDFVELVGGWAERGIFLHVAHGPEGVPLDLSNSDTRERVSEMFAAVEDWRMFGFRETELASRIARNE